MCTNTVHRNKKTNNILLTLGTPSATEGRFKGTLSSRHNSKKKASNFSVTFLFISLFQSRFWTLSFKWRKEIWAALLRKETQLKDTFPLCVLAAISAALLSLAKASSPRSLPLFDFGNSEKQQQQQQHTAPWLCVGLCLTAHYVARWMQRMQLFLVSPPWISPSTCIPDAGLIFLLPVRMKYKCPSAGKLMELNEDYFFFQTGAQT